MGDSKPLSDQGSLDSSEPYEQRVARLSLNEEFWVRKQPLLQARGYVLRSRYTPGWEPSWRGAGGKVYGAEDAVSAPFLFGCIDATRACDGRMVYLKRVPTDGEELAIARLFSEGNMRSDGTNHCVPILDVIADDAEPNTSYIVMPFLRHIDRPPFEGVEDVVHFVDQMLEGLTYMHNHGVAHRDCAGPNLMMDASPLFPKGFHPVVQGSLPTFTGRAPTMSRLRAKPLDYYFIDFGIAVRVPFDQDANTTLGDTCIDPDVPELSTTVPYNPFKVDVFLIGNVFRKQILAKFSNVDFLRPLAKSMTRHNPEDRPHALAALKQWESIRGDIFMLHRGWRLRRKQETNGQAIVLDVVWLLRLGLALSERFLRYTIRLAILFRQLF